MDELVPGHPESDAERGAAAALAGGLVGPPASAAGNLADGNTSTAQAGGVAGALDIAARGAEASSPAAAQPMGGFTQDPPAPHASIADESHVSGDATVEHVGSLVETAKPLPIPGGKGIDGATVVSISVIVAGLVVVAWIRARQGLLGQGAKAVHPGGAHAGKGGLRHVVQPGEGPGEIEQTAIALAALVREADVRIMELTRLRDELRTQNGDRGLVTRSDGVAEPQESSFECAAGRIRGFAANGARGRHGDDLVRSIGIATQVQPVPACADPMADRVYELADSGLSSVEIASALHEHTGKIELILALRRASAAGEPQAD